MKILTLGNPKGGVGKSTAAVSLAGFYAERGLNVCLVDLDEPQLSAQGTVQGAKDPVLQRLPCLAYDLPPLRDLKIKADLLVIDLPGRQEVRMREALEVSDLLLVPVAASVYETWQLQQMALFLNFENARRRKTRKGVLQARALVNRYEPGDPLNQALEAELRNSMIAPLANRFRTLRGFRRALAKGLLPRLSEHVEKRDRAVIAEAEKDVSAVAGEVAALLGLGDGAAP